MTLQDEPEVCTNSNVSEQGSALLPVGTTSSCSALQGQFLPNPYMKKVSFIDQACLVKIAVYQPSSFCKFVDQDAKKVLGQYPAILISCHLVKNPYKIWKLR